MKKKGFTLIELLAVIVILAIIMVIAVPQILNVINSSTDNAWVSNVKMVRHAINTNSRIIESGATYKTSPRILCDNETNTNKDVTNNIKTIAKIDNTTIECKKNTDYIFTLTGSNKFDGKVATITCLEDGNCTEDTEGPHEAVENNLVIDETTFFTMGQNSNRSWTGPYEDAIDSGMWEGDPTGAYYINKITVTSKTPATLKGKVSLWYNCTSKNAKFRIGFSQTNDINKDNFTEYQELDQNHKSMTVDLPKSTYEGFAQNFEVTITTPGEYYIKSVYYMTSKSCSAYSRTFNMSLTQ